MDVGLRISTSDRYEYFSSDEFFFSLLDVEQLNPSFCFKCALPESTMHLELIRRNLTGKTEIQVGSIFNLVLCFPKTFKWSKTV